MINELFSSMTASDDAARSFNSSLVSYQVLPSEREHALHLAQVAPRASARQCKAGPPKGTQPDFPGRDRPGSSRIRASGPRHKDKKEQLLLQVTTPAQHSIRIILGPAALASPEHSGWRGLAQLPSSEFRKGLRRWRLPDLLVQRTRG